MKLYDDYINSGLAKADYEKESTGNFFIMSEFPDQEPGVPTEQNIDMDAFNVK